MKSYLIFLAGVAIGGVTAWFIAKRKFEKELSETRNAYVTLDEEVKTTPLNVTVTAQSIGCADIVNALGYSTFSGSPTEKPDDNDPYIIAPGRFEEEGIYQKAYLSYNVLDDEVLGPDGSPFDIYEAHDVGEQLTTIELLGSEFLEEATDSNGADLIYVRNPSLQYDFEVDVIR